MIPLIRDAKVVCIDADDTTADFFWTFLQYYNARYGTPFTIGDFKTRKFHLVWGCSREEAIRRIDDFQHSSYYRRILPLEGSVEGARSLFEAGKKLYVVTSRSDYTRQDTERFYQTYFPGIVSDIIHSANKHSGDINSGKTKAEICGDFGAPLIDDDLVYVQPCAETAFGGVLFGDYPWQNGQELPLRVERGKNWEDILK